MMMPARGGVQMSPTARAAGCGCFGACGAAVMVAIGCSILALARKDPRGVAVASYTASVGAWSGGGESTFATTFPANVSVTLLVVPSAGANVQIPLNVSNVLMSLADSIPDQPSYPRTYSSWWLSGSLAAATYSTGSPSSSSSFSITVVGTTLTASVPVWKCSVSSTTTQNDPHCKQNCASTTTYTRDLSVLTAVQLQVGFPSTCGNASTCTPSSLSVTTCGSSWRSVNSLPVSGNTACTSIPTMDLAAPNVIITVRSAADPYLAAGNLTSCSYDFGTTAAQYRSSGIGFTVGGFLLFFFCVGVGVLMRKRAAANKMLTPMGVEMMSQPYYGQQAGMGYGGVPGYAPMAVQQPMMVQPAYGQQPAYGGMQPAYAPAQGQQQQWQQPQQQLQQPAYGGLQPAFVQQPQLQQQQQQQYAAAPAGGYGR